MFKVSRGGIGRLVVVSVLGLTGLALASPASPVIGSTDAVQCFPGTGGAAPPSSPYPARAYLPLVVSSRVAVCADESEPNDTHTAAQVVTGSCVAASVPASADADWYALRVCSPVTLTVRTKGPLDSPLDIDLYLHGDPPGMPLASSEGPGLGELVAARLITGTYYALVQPAAGSGPYEVWFEVQR